MRKNLYWQVRVLVIGGAALLSACASYRGSGLQPGVATLPEVVVLMGEPAMRWKDADGRAQLAYPRGPSGTQTFMAVIAADGRLEKIEGVLDTEHFARIRSGTSDQAAVLRVIGPPQPHWTVYFKARDELVWSWRYCNSWSQQAFFDVLFDATTGIVRSTYQRPDMGGADMGPPGCGQ